MSFNVDKMKLHDKYLREDNYYQYSLLLDIVKTNDLEALDYYINEGYDVNIRNEHLATVAHHLGYATLDTVEKLVEYGLDVHAISTFGTSALTSVCVMESEDSAEVMKYLLSKGLNPYNKNFLGRTTFDYVNDNEIITEAFLIEHSLFQEASPSIESAIKAEDWILLTEIMQEEIRLQGGFDRILEMTAKDLTNTAVARIQQIMVLLKKYEEATSLIRFYLDEKEKTGFNSKVMVFEPTAPFMQKDVETLKEIVEINWDYYRNFSEKARNFFDYVLLKITLDELGLEDKVLRAKAEAYIERKDHFAPFYSALFEENTSTAYSIIQRIEAYAEKQGSANRGYPQFALGALYFYKKDWVNAEYMFRKAINEWKNTDNRLFLYVTASHAMIDYIQSQK